MSRTYRSSTLVSLCRKRINCLLRQEKDIKALEVPTCLKKKLTKHYLTDKFWSDDYLPPLEPHEITLSFGAPFEIASTDEFLTLHNWIYNVPEFAFEMNHLKCIWYEIDNNNDQLCFDCILCIHRDQPVYARGKPVIKKYCCSVVPGDELIEEIQQNWLWCSRCFTTTLFYIEDYPFYAHRSTIIEESVVGYI